MSAPPRALAAPPARGAASRTWLRALDATKSLDREGAATLGGAVNDIAERLGARTALLDDAGSLTYAALAARMNRYARWAVEEGIAPGTVIGLLMPNGTDYAAVWLGLSQVGCAVALVNTNLTGERLVHALRAAGCAHLIVAGALAASWRAVAPDCAGIRLWAHGEGADAALPRIDLAIAALDPARPDFTDRAPPRGPDRALLIYTSGTTGLPKAANVSHARILQWSYWFAGLMDIAPEDVLYDCLPLYHGTGGVSALGAMLVRGASVFIRPRFSASRFWAEVAESGATIFQYIGELCRYLVQAPPGAMETRHNLRLCCGNGLRGDVWEKFQARFAVPQILEFYAATEGAVSLYNCEGKPGAIGRVPGFLAHRFPLALVRCDLETGELLRDAFGLCIPCIGDEPGEAIGRLDPASRSAARQFEGYTDALGSARKLARDVFSPGDRWYRTGDLMRRDKEGFYYFIDRLGDAFRWKGENVSASEVAGVVAGCAGVADAVAFGVAVPGTEGRAGMAALVPAEGFSLAALRAHLHAQLPPYARPLFLRLCGDIERTGTFKLAAGRLAREGYAPPPGPDTLWFDDRAAGAYVPLDAARLGAVGRGAAAL